ncbi:class I SAM-dependent methyltransferase [uncultured Lamprocystis sp.]|uniref:class I SAM-dependent methyltransferase n=1 Tax=uncultured Lamprocystis sp. TaxID=543132 RepID=UPI0034574D54
MGGAEALADVEGQFDLGLAIDVLGYLDDAELDVFYKNMARIIKPGGHLVVMYGNELLDVFALNAGTSAFFGKHFGLDVVELLTEAKAPRPNNATRKNPLSFGAEIAPYGFEEVSQAFSQWHTTPPGLANRSTDLVRARLDMRDHSFDANTLPEAERWKAAFRCSIFASMAVRN